MTTDSPAATEIDRSELLKQGCDSFRNRAWSAAFSQLSAADRETPLEPQHLVLLAQAALLIGKEAEGTELLARAQQGFVSRQENAPGARCAFWLGFTALLNGEIAKAGGWLSRAARLLEGEPDCVERGYLLLPEGYRAVHGGDPQAAISTFRRAAEIANEFRDTELLTLALQGQGRALIRNGDFARGLALLDEAMIAVTSGEVSALNVGGVYCSVLEGCGEVFDLQRAQEWTNSLKQWCDSQPDLVPYRGLCLVRRAEVLLLRGAWPDALEEAHHACDLLSEPMSRPGLAAAFYQLGEIERLRGNLTEAEQAFEQANQLSPNLGPGLARLRLAQQRIEAAAASIRRMAEEVHEPARRALVLDAYVEIALSAGDAPAARRACDELREIAQRFGFPFLRALSLRCEGAVLIAEDDIRGALSRLREAWDLWNDLQVPYEAARARCMSARAYRDLGDAHNAALEGLAARKMYEELGAAIDLAAIDEAVQSRKSRPATPLSEREVEVLRLVASGMTNRRIAEQLFISEKTVARHLSNIFTKLDLQSRTAATAYAFEHKLV